MRALSNRSWVSSAPPSRRAIIAFLAAGFAGFVAFLAYYNDAFPEASIDFRISREEAATRSRALLASLDFDLAGYRDVTTLAETRTDINYLERKLGLSKANELFRDTVSVWRWSTRFYRELEEVEYAVLWDISGKLAGLHRKLPENEARPEIPEAVARRVAEEFLAGPAGVDLAQYELIERQEESQPNRLDRTLTWRRIGFDVDGAELRRSVTLQGDEIGHYDTRLKIPEAWSRERTALRKLRDTVNAINGLPILALSLAAVVFFVIALHRRRTHIRAALPIAVAVGLLVIAVQINALPLMLRGYPTTDSFLSFAFKTIAFMLLGGLGAGIGTLGIVAVADAAGRFRPFGPAQRFDALEPRLVRDPGVYRRVLCGYALAFVSLGYVTLFYVAGIRWFGAWTPVDIRFSETFSTWFPSLQALLVGVSAASGEEGLFRLFAIAFLWRITGRPWLSVLLPAIVWGFAHTSYPQEPVYIRGVELTLEGVLFGLVFLRFGIVTTLVSHCVFNTFVGVVPHFQSGDPRLIVFALLALAAPVGFVFAADRAAIRYRRKRGAASTATPAPIPEMPDALASSPVSAATGVLSPGRTVAALAVIAALAIAATTIIDPPDPFGAPPPVTMTPAEAEAISTRYLRDLGYNPEGFRSFTTFDDDRVGLPLYAVAMLGPDDAADRFGAYYARAPQWRTQWYKFETIDRYSVTIADDGRLLRFDADLPEDAPGASIVRTDAIERATDAMRRFDFLADGDWVVEEVDEYARPARLDFDVEWLDESFELAGLRREIEASVAGDRVAGLYPARYDVPDAWERERRMRADDPLHTVWSFAPIAGFLIIGLVVIVRLGRAVVRGQAKRADLHFAIVCALLFGFVASAAWTANKLPGFYDDYAQNTEEPATQYVTRQIAIAAIGALGDTATIFIFAFLASLAIRTATGDESALRHVVLADPDGVARPGSVLRALACGLLAFAIFMAAKYIEDDLHYLFVPTETVLSASASSLMTREVSYLLNAPLHAQHAFQYAAGWTVVVGSLWPFFRTRRIGMSAAIVWALITAERGDTAGEDLFHVAMSLVQWIGIYVFVTVLARRQGLAYLVMFWAMSVSGQFYGLYRFGFASSHPFDVATIERSVLVFGPIVALTIWGVVRWRRCATVTWQHRPPSRGGALNT
ncbi:CPBP family intramembrane metalloprotease [bacterium]|nr:CPBP family intramembrane metalloprotease [bacterium]